MTGCVWSDVAATLIIAILTAIAARYGVKFPQPPAEPVAVKK